jgi:hypothetical protein
MFATPPRRRHLNDAASGTGWAPSKDATVPTRAPAVDVADAEAVGALAAITPTCSHVYSSNLKQGTSNSSPAVPLIRTLRSSRTNYAGICVTPRQRSSANGKPSRRSRRNLPPHRRHHLRPLCTATGHPPCRLHPLKGILFMPSLHQPGMAGANYCK